MRGDLARRMPCRPMSRMSRTGGAPPPRDRPRGARRSRGGPARRASCGPRTPSSCSCGRDRSRFAGRHRAHSWHWAAGCGGRSRRSGRSRHRRRPASRRPGAGPEVRPVVIDERVDDLSSGAHTPPGRRYALALRRISLARPRPAHPRRRLLDAPGLVGGGSRPVAGVDPGPPDPSAQDPGADSPPPRRSDAPPTPGRSGSAPATRRHPSRPLAQLQRVLP